MWKSVLFSFFFCTTTYIVASRGKVVKTRVFNSLNFFLASSYNSVTLVVDRFICNTVLVLRREWYDYRYNTIESIWKNFVTFLHKFFHIDSIGNTFKCTRKKLVYKSYKVFSYRFYRYPTIVWCASQLVALPTRCKSFCSKMRSFQLILMIHSVANV